MQKGPGGPCGRGGGCLVCGRGRRDQLGEKEDNQIPKGPEWLTNPWFWVQIVTMAIVLVAIRYFTNGGFVF